MSVSKILVVAAVGGVVAASSLAGCGGDDTGGSTGGTTTGGSGGECSPTDPTCTKVASECIALEDNKAKDKFGLRMSQLIVTQPAVLAAGFVAGIVRDGVTMNLDKCFLKGGGTFNWLLEFDKATGKLRTGGAKPQQDPTAGYCFTQETVTQGANSFDIAPIEIDAPIDASGMFSAATGADVIVPIYLDIEATNVVLLPLHEARIFNGMVSADNNCIGKFNTDGEAPLTKSNLCLPDPDNGVFSFQNGGELDGYITLEEADTVIVSTLGQSLCVLLSGDPGQYGQGADPQVCKRDGNGKILLTGDTCSTTYPSPDAGCADSFKLGAKFAASAVKINTTCP